MASSPVRSFGTRIVAVLFLSVASMVTIASTAATSDDRVMVLPRENPAAPDDSMVAEFIRAARRAPFELATPRLPYDVSVARRTPNAVTTLAVVASPGRAAAPRQSVPSRSRRKLRVWERDVA